MITILDDLVYDPHTLYHVSPKLFDFPSRVEINKAREWSRWHANGVLGLWCSTRPNMCSPFGKHVYEVTLKEGCRRIGLPFREFSELTSQAEDFDPIIDYLCAEGDVAYLVDAIPEVGEVIVLNFDQIATFIEVTDGSPKDFKASLHSEQGMDQYYRRSHTKRP